MRPGDWVDLIHALCIDPQSDWSRIHGDPLQGVTFLSAANVLRQVRRIVFIHTFQERFQDNALRAVRNLHAGIMYRHASFLETMLIERCIIAISGKATGLIHDNGGEHPRFSIGDHPLKLWAIIGAAADGVVAVLPYYLYAVGLCPLPAFAQLILDRRFPLIIGGVACIDHGNVLWHTDSLIFQSGNARHIQLLLPL